MGAFYGSVHVRTGETADLRRVLEELAADGKTRFLLGRPAAGWTAVYPSGGGQDFAISAAIAARLAGPVIHLLVHDDDLFAYRLYDAGGVIDEYDSNPDYFQPSPPARWKETEGRPEALAALAGDGDHAELARILSRDGHGDRPLSRDLADDTHRGAARDSERRDQLRVRAGGRSRGRQGLEAVRPRAGSDRRKGGQAAEEGGGDGRAQAPPA